MRNACTALSLLCFFWSQQAPAAAAVHMAMGLRVGEVRHDSAIVWTRLTRDQTRVMRGHREPKKRTRKQKQYVPSPVPVEKREGESVGVAGEIRLVLTPLFGDRRSLQTPWVAVTAKNDFIHQFTLRYLKPGKRYALQAQGREKPDAPVSATAAGSFQTPAPASVWQDVRFTVVTGQSYWDLDHPDGFHIYPAMAKLKPHFLIPTGDTVYLDSEAPRARTTALARYHWHRMYSLPRHVRFHRSVPGYWEVDDHDSWCDDCWPTKKAAFMLPLTFKEGFRIYREQNPLGKRTYRTIRWGKGLQIWLVEGRLYRSANTMPDGPDKTIWGKQQLEWLKRTIRESDAHFKVLISPTPIVGPDRARGKNDNHYHKAFATEGNHFRQWTKQQGIKNFYACCGDRHWQYMSIDPKSGLREFSCGPASDKHAGGNPQQPSWQPFLRVKGGFLSVSVTQEAGSPTIAFRHHDVQGKVVHQFKASSAK